GRSTTTASASVTQPGAPNHHTQWKINGQVVFDETGFGCFQFKADVEVPASSLSHTTNLNWVIVGDLPVATMYQALTYWSFEYPQEPNFNNVNRHKFKIENSSEGKIRLDYTNLGIGNPVILTFGS